ncbi:unnamed protein product [Microthlaspi erraticum]|uniref:Uncharacterized protein n=1 Tax=Microthlaspi erraticum TaxID=1685480 RepID=A0A6D2HY46_9BRAS|nr:unnamed protein product [Microthlaspi erraticum]
MFRVGQNQIRPSEVSAKVQTIRPSTHHDPGKQCPAVGQATTTHAMPRTTMPREPGSNASRPRPNSRTTADGIRPSREARPASGRESIGQSSPVRPQRPTANVRPRPSDSDHDHNPIRPIVPTDRPNAAVDPKPVLKPVSRIFKPGLTLSRL